MIGPARFNYSALVRTLQWLKGNDRSFAFLSNPGYIDHHCLVKESVDYTGAAFYVFRAKLSIHLQRIKRTIQ